MSATISFLPWVRQGAASAIATPDPLDDGLPAHATLPVRLHLDGVTAPVVVQLRVMGPADVTGLDVRQVVRMEPRPGTTNFPPSYFTAIELDRPDLPWLFTPARAEDEQGRLRPWLVLVVVRDQSGVRIRPGGSGLPVLEIRSPAIPADELPDLSESWAWAHAQVVHGGADIGSVLAREPRRTVSRLLCPRRLRPFTRYHACLVPAFETGRKAGLGLPIGPEDEAGLRPAWESGPDAPSKVELPLYHHWTFTTGAEEDFEAAVRRLHALGEIPPRVGGLRLHVEDAGAADLPDLGILDFAGVFRAPNAPPPLPPASPTPQQASWMAQLTAWLNHADDAASGEATDAIVTIPLYGQYAQALRRLPDGESWVRDLNLDPRNRAAAGLGVLFVQWHQEELMASAWAQLAEYREAQEVMRTAELALEVGKATVAKRFAPMQGRGEMLYQMVSPAHANVELQDRAVTIATWADNQGRPKPASLAAFRRIARPAGPIARRLRTTDTSISAPIEVRQPRVGSAGMASIQPYVAPLATRIEELSERRAAWNRPGNDEAVVARASAAVDALRAELERIAGIATPQEAPPLRPFDNALQQSVLSSLGPTSALIQGLRRNLSPGALAFVDGAEGGSPNTFGPEFPLPMYEAVRELMPELLLAGAHEIPDDTVTVLETNPQFIEAFLVGLNHEMARELLWRGAPTDLKGTPFRYFWGSTPEANRERTPDIPPLHQWPATNRLGGNLVGGDVEGKLALLFKGDLLRRFPNTVIYAVQANPDGSLSSNERHPLQRGNLGEDAAFLLFDLTEAEARGGPAPGGDGGPGWYFMLQEQPSEARFGLDAVAATPAPATWGDLAWDHVVTSPGGYLRITESAEDLAGVSDTSGLAWGVNGAHMADITLQRPFRLAIHARRLL